MGRRCEKSLIVRDRTRNLSLRKRCTYHLHHSTSLYIFVHKCGSENQVTWNSAMADPTVRCCILLSSSALWRTDQKKNDSPPSKKSPFTCNHTVYTPVPCLVQVGLLKWTKSKSPSVGGSPTATTSTTRRKHESATSDEQNSIPISHSIACTLDFTCKKNHVSMMSFKFASLINMCKSFFLVISIIIMLFFFCKFILL